MCRLVRDGRLLALMRQEISIHRREFTTVSRRINLGRAVIEVLRRQDIALGVVMVEIPDRRPIARIDKHRTPGTAREVEFLAAIGLHPFPRGRVTRKRQMGEAFRCIGKGGLNRLAILQRDHRAECLAFRDQLIECPRKSCRIKRSMYAKTHGHVVERHARMNLLPRPDLPLRCR